MGSFHKYKRIGQVFPYLRRVPAGVWMVIGAIGVLLMGLLVWAGISLASWLWSQAPHLAETGKEVAKESMALVDKASPELKQGAEMLAGDSLTLLEGVAPEVSQVVKRWLPQGGVDLPEQDVSGSDIGPVLRYPGLVRISFKREEDQLGVVYTGRADLASVLEHYDREFTSNTYTHEVVSATQTEERHRFQNDREVIEMTLRRRDGGVLEVVMRQWPQ